MGFVPSPSSQNFPSSGSTSSRGPSPLPPSSSDHGYYQQPGAQYSQQSLPSSGGGSYRNGGQSPYGQTAPQLGAQLTEFGPAAPLHQQNGYATHSGMPQSQSAPLGSFAPPSAPFAQSGYSSNRTSSRASTQSNGSNDSSAYPPFDTRGAPPPLPKEMSYNGQAISGRGGPLYATSLSAGGYDSRSIGSHRGDSGLLSPGGSIHRSCSADGLRGDALAQRPYRMPSAALEDRAASAPGASRTLSKLSTSGSTLHQSGGGGRQVEEDSPPPSPVVAREPDKTRIVAEMRCKIFLQQQHSQWKSLGTAKLKLFLSQPSNTKQLVVDSDKKGATLVSTIVLTDGVERVGKTGVAIELSDQGDRTGIVYMLQVRRPFLSFSFALLTCYPPRTDEDGAVRDRPLRTTPHRLRPHSQVTDVRLPLLLSFHKSTSAITITTASLTAKDALSPFSRTKLFGLPPLFPFRSRSSCHLLDPPSLIMPSSSSIPLRIPPFALTLRPPVFLLPLFENSIPLPPSPHTPDYALSSSCRGSHVTHASRPLESRSDSLSSRSLPSPSLSHSHFTSPRSRWLRPPRRQRKTRG